MHIPAGNGNKMKWIGFTGEGSKEKSVWYKVTYYQHLEPRTFHSQNGWYFLEAWIVLQVSHLLKYQKEELWRLSGALEYICVAPQKTNEKCLKNNLSPRVDCCWAISRGLVSVHINVFSKNPLRFDGLRWREKLTKYNWFYGVDLSWWRYGC